MNDKEKVKRLFKHIGVMSDRNQETVEMFLNTKQEDILKIIAEKRAKVWDDLHTLNDEKYISRQKFLYALDDVIELWEEHIPTPESEEQNEPI